MHFSPMLDSWVITRYEDVFQAFLHPRFRYDRISASMSALPPEMQESCAPLGEHVSNWLGYTDPPKHTRLRGLLRTTFTPKLAKALTDRVVEITDELIDNMRGRARRPGGGLRFPAAGSGHMRDSRHTEGRRAQLCRVVGCDGVFTGHIGPTLVEIAPRAMASYVDLEGFFGGLVEQRTACPADDLVTKLAVDEGEGRLSRQELIGLDLRS